MPYQAMFVWDSTIRSPTIPVPGEVFDSVENKQQFENALYAMTASYESGDNLICQRNILWIKLWKRSSSFRIPIT